MTAFSKRFSVRNRDNAILATPASLTNPDGVCKQLPKFTKLGPEVAAKLILPTCLTAVPKESIELFSTYAKELIPR
jgi:hypothetical protein